MKITIFELLENSNYILTYCSKLYPKIFFEFLMKIDEFFTTFVVLSERIRPVLNQIIKFVAKLEISLNLVPKFRRALRNCVLISSIKAGFRLFVAY